MISAGIDTRPAIAKLQAWRARLRATLRTRFVDGADALLQAARAKLSGEVLQTRSGALRASLRAELRETADGLAARVWSDGSVPYACIQEYGGRIALPETAPANAKALAFAYGGKMVFARRAAAHMVEIPERSYMRSSLREFAPAFLDTIRRIATDISR